MKKQDWNNRKLSLLATFLVLPFLTACGGGDDNDKASNSSTNNSSTGTSVGGAVLCVAVILTSGNDSCASSGGSSGSSSDPHALRRGVKYVVNDEVEPNDDRSNANALNILLTTEPDGFVAYGAVNDVSDQHDYYTLARPSTRHFRFVLCADGSNLCNQYGEIDSLTAYIDILDSTGNVIASSQAADRNLVEPLLSAGLPYFVRVVAGDTVGSTVAYQLTAHEFEPN